MAAQEFNECPRCARPVPAPFRAHVENLGGCPEPAETKCVGCVVLVRPGHPEDHAAGCPTGQNGAPNYG